jgi:acetyltransferase-like isoleucine patch superfamily enzyme
MEAEQLVSPERATGAARIGGRTMPAGEQDILSPFRRIRSTLNRLRRFYYTRRAARALGCSPSQLDVSGPCVIHGGGRFVIGNNVSLRATPRLPIELYCAPAATITLHDNCFLNQGTHIACMREVTIGEHCLIADQALIMDTDFHAVGDQPIASASVIIQRGAWLGARAIVLKGVTIGEGAIIGAGAVVARSIPARAVAVGNPARVVRSIAGVDEV